MFSTDAEVAAFINENYIPVLVDRDERPDIDMLYQGAAGLMGHAGGWPLNIFLMPDGVPFWVAGYQPKDDKPEIPSFARVARETLALWKDERARAEDTAGKAAQYDVVVSDALATVLTGGDTDYLDTLTEDDISKLERKAFIGLCKQDGTVDRIETMLNTGKPLRN